MFSIGFNTYIEVSFLEDVRKHTDRKQNSPIKHVTLCSEQWITSVRKPSLSHNIAFVNSCYICILHSLYKGRLTKSLLNGLELFQSVRALFANFYLA